ncbi:MAG: hypothetical protein Athens101428_702 [Candidatus Berkelbacteria bacterium Athens1014_28]|uniref:PEGA domain-containing protein n=1 Tax=Candidatus Berkelbacteria bacterium Athens1014_28 TaxID=2017145 RepID=A0A554LKE1_9BACT|nr:MAG: hypothetical protein Athens101428_702 [Candidatus Berkelbacteria bacterium Athens1014_28]
MQHHQKLIILASLSLTVFFFALFLYFVLFNKAKITINFKPENAVVTFDNAPVESKNGSASFSADFGKHTIKVEADGYIGFVEELDLKKGRGGWQKSVNLTLAPVPIEIAKNIRYSAISSDKIYYQSTSDKLFYLSKIAGNKQLSDTQPMTSKPLENIDDLLWSPTKELMLIKRGSTLSMFDFQKYDFLNQKESLFASYAGDYAWAPDDSRIAYVYSPPTGEKSIIFADKTGTEITRVANLNDLNIKNPYIAFSPNSEWLVVIPRNSNYDQNKIYLLNVYTKELRQVGEVNNVKEAVFSADSQKIIYSAYDTDPANPTHRRLYMINLDGSGNVDLKIAAKATGVRYWNSAEKFFLLENSVGGKLKLADKNIGRVSDFYFKGQVDSNITELHLNEDKSGAIYVSGGTLYFVKLQGN